MKTNLKKATTLFIALFSFAFVQAQTAEVADSVAVSGNCGMCKKNIEKGASEAGATYAFWDRRSKVLNVKFDSTKTSMKKIEQKIAEKGYDTENERGSDEAYSKLEECCHYERREVKPAKKKG